MENEMKEVVVDGIVYVPKEEVNKKKVMSIVTVDGSGLTYVGLYDKEEPSILRNARCVIRWGTSGHLAQLAGTGPLESTKLGDEVPYVEFGSGFSVRIPAPGFESE
jgi:hypothetical protein